MPNKDVDKQHECVPQNGYAIQGEVDKQHKCVPQKGCAIQGEVNEQHEVPIRSGSLLRFEPGNSGTHSQRATATPSVIEIIRHLYSPTTCVKGGENLRTGRLKVRNVHRVQVHSFSPLGLAPPQRATQPLYGYQ